METKREVKDKTKKKLGEIERKDVKFLFDQNFPSVVLSVTLYRCLCVYVNNGMAVVFW